MLCIDGINTINSFCLCTCLLVTLPIRPSGRHLLFGTNLQKARLCWYLARHSSQVCYIITISQDSLTQHDKPRALLNRSIAKFQYSNEVACITSSRSYNSFTLVPSNSVVKQVRNECVPTLKTFHRVASTLPLHFCDRLFNIKPLAVVLHFIGASCCCVHKTPHFCRCAPSIVSLLPLFSEQLPGRYSQRSCT